MRWVAKAALQRGLGLVPQGERLNYLFQRHVAHSLPAGESVFQRKFARAEQHVAAYQEHGPGTPLADAVFYEFGVGWDLAIPLSYASLGVGRQVLVDIRPSARVELVNDSLSRLERRSDPVARGARGALRDRVPRTVRRARDRAARRVRRLRLQYGRLRARSRGRPGRDLPRVLPPAAAGWRLQLPDRPAGPLLVLRPRASRATTSCASPRGLGRWSIRRSISRTGCAHPTTCGSFATPASSSSSSGRPGLTSAVSPSWAHCRSLIASATATRRRSSA